MKSRVLISLLAAVATLAGLASMPAAVASLGAEPGAGATVTVPGPFGRSATAVCAGGTWVYAANLGVFVGSCYDPPNLAGLDYEYVPGEQDESSGPCVETTGGFSGQTDVCVDTSYWIGPWGPCKVVADGGTGVYSSFCWDGRDATAPPSAHVFFNGSNHPCVKIERPGFEGHVDACLTP